MNKTRTLTAALGLTLALVACGTRTEQQSTSSFTPTPENTSMPVVQTVLNLSPEVQGFVKNQISNSKNVSTDAQQYDAVIINAQSYTDQDLEVARTALKDHKRVIIDSSTGNIESSKKVQAALIGGSIGSAAVIIDNFGDGNYTVTPLEQSSGVSRQGDSGVAEDNSVQNVLGLE